MSQKIKLGMVGGGQGAFIGAVHRIASRIDDRFELVAGAFSSDPDKSLASGKELGVSEDRNYSNYEEMAENFWGNDEDVLVDFSPVFNADKMKSRILMWHGLQDPISPILHLDLMKEALEENNIDYQSFTMTRLGHTFGREEDMRAHFPVIKDFLFE